MPPTETLAERLMRLRKERGLSRGELARQAALDQSTVWRLESTSRNRPEAGTIHKLARVLGVSAEYLLGIAESAREEVTQAQIRVPVLLRACEPPAENNVREWLNLPNVLELGSYDDLFALEVTAEHTRGCEDTWRVGDIALCSARAATEDGSTILLATDDDCVIRQLRVVGTVLAAADSSGQLTPISQRRIIARVVASLRGM
ncbi:MAG: helix-turn-helix domain-containing protein [Armatimonadota bacterium]